MDPKLETLIDDAGTVLTSCFPDLVIQAHVTCAAGPGKQPIRWRRGSHTETRERSEAASVGPLLFGPVAPGTSPVPDLTAWITLPQNASRETLPDPGGAMGALRAIWPTGFEELKHRYERALALASRWRLPWTPARALTPIPGIALPPRTGERPVIVMALHWLGIGGAEAFALACIGQAVAQGFDVIVVSDQPALDPGRMVLPDLPNVRRLRTDLFCDEALFDRLLRQLVLRGTVAALHIHHSRFAYASLRHLPGGPGRPLVIDTTHIVEHEDGGSVRLSGRHAPSIDHHHVISDTLRRFYRDRFGLAPTVRLGYLLGDRADTPPRLFSILDPKPVVTIGFVGRLVHQKRPSLFVEVARRLVASNAADRPRFRFVMVGDGPYGGRVEAEIARHGLGDHVALLGHRADAAALMESFDILLVPSSNEGLTLVAYEAWTAGTLVISSNVGAQHELVPPDLLIDPAPLRFCTEATARIRRLAGDPIFCRDQIEAFRALHAQVAAGPRATTVMASLYAEAHAAWDDRRVTL